MDKPKIFRDRRPCWVCEEAGLAHQYHWFLVIPDQSYPAPKRTYGSYPAVLAGLNRYLEDRRKEEARIRENAERTRRLAELYGEAAQPKPLRLTSWRWSPA